MKVLFSDDEVRELYKDKNCNEVTCFLISLYSTCFVPTPKAFSTNLIVRKKELGVTVTIAVIIAVRKKNRQSTAIDLKDKHTPLLSSEASE
jgi:hypothetical protein